KQCAECVRACPSGALRTMDNVIRVDRSKCLSCGACVEACPQRAVEFPGCSAEEFEAHLDALLRTDAGVTGRAILFVCGNDRAPVEDGWLPMRVPCVVMVPTAAILRSLAAGATTVGMRPCGPECPASADEIVRGRVDYCQQLLRLLGESPDRVRLLDPDGSPAPAPMPPVLAASKPTGPVSLFGRGAAARAVTAMAGCHGAHSMAFDHEYSPLGLVRVNPQACTSCGNCAGGCPTRALSYERRGENVALVYDAALCTGCGRCFSLCPEKNAGAITVTRTTDVSRLAKGPDVLLQDAEVRCKHCGAPFASRRMMEHLTAVLGADYGAAIMAPLCTDCKGLPAARA
ncbi:MAG: 4Fe-4S binding protein, partial [Chloroflexota bacterium]